jgi:rhamnosyltransferase
MEVSVSVIIPTYNAAPYLERQLKALLSQSVQPAEIVLVDSSSSDGTVAIAKQYPVKIIAISKDDFDHGSTRTLAGTRSRGQFIVYLTQDAIPCDDNCIENLLKPMLAHQILAAVHGKQLPCPDATPFARHLRCFNYSDRSYIRTLADKKQHGLKTAFCSNSFAAYRRNVLDSIGWFKPGLILGEDMEICARLLLKGYSIGYVAEARVYHSHNYNPVEDFKRYFDTGVLHACEQWLLQEFGHPRGEGIRYVQSEVAFLIANRLFHILPVSLLRSVLKFAGYRLGLCYSILPLFLRRRFSMRGKSWNWSTAKTQC